MHKRCEENATSEDDENPAVRKQSAAPKQVKHKWMKQDLTAVSIEWNLPEPSLDSSESPMSLFEKFLSIGIVNQICEQSTLYAASKGSNFSMDESLF